jgi:hypothetical protein
MELVKKFGGKKFVALILWVIVQLFAEKLGLAPAEVENMTKGLMAYFVGQGVADGFSKGATSHA